MTRLILLVLLMVLDVLVVRTSSLGWLGFKFGGHWWGGHRHKPLSRESPLNHDCQTDHEDWLNEFGGPFEINGCECMLFAERELVFLRKGASSWFSCTPWGLFRCGEYCDGLLEDENVKFRSRQNACDTLGREVHTAWYRRHQVCGYYGPYEDYRMREDLCCRRGRPSDYCQSSQKK